MYASGEEFSPVGTVFSTQLVDLYARTLGEWARPVVLIAVLTTMFSTSLTVLDGFPRAIERSIVCIKDGPERGSDGRCRSRLLDQLRRAGQSPRSSS